MTVCPLQVLGMAGHQEEGETLRHYVKYIEDNSYCPIERVNFLLNGMRQEIYDHLRRELQNGNINISWEDCIEAAEDAEWLHSLYLRERFRVGSKTQEFNHHGFVVDWEGFIEVHTDGACSGNGRPGAKAGIGIWFGYDNHPL